MRLKRDKPAQPALFAEALREWLDRSGLKRADVAKQSHVERSTFSHWLRGDRPPDPVNGVQLLITLYHQFQALCLDWTVAEALDGIAPLGWAWEDVWHTLTTAREFSAERNFQDWWQQGKPNPLPESTPPLPIPFIPRTEQNLLRRLLTDWISWRQARWKAVILSGVAGIGKTTLLTALARDSALRHHFRDGILWLDGTKNLLEQAAHRVGLQGPLVIWREEWARWAGTPHRRLLVIVDDVLPDKDLETLVAPSGPQVVFALTTQRGPEVRALLERWVRPDRVTEVILHGLREEEGFTLIQQVQERLLGEQERETVRRVGIFLGWHPEGLRIAAGMAREMGSGGDGERRSGGAGGQRSGWEEVLAFLEEEGLKGGEWNPLLRLLERQWERMSPERREWVDCLVWRTARGGPLEEPLAGAIWDVRPEAARLILRDLERTGLVERVAVHPAEWWRSPEVVMWRLTPVVFRVRRGTNSGPQGQRERKRWQRQAIHRRDWVSPDKMPPSPVSLTITATLINTMGILPKLLVWLALRLAERIARREGWSDRWQQWTAIWTPLTRLQIQWAAQGIFQSEEMDLLVARTEWTGILLLISAVGIGALIDLGALGVIWFDHPLWSLVVRNGMLVFAAIGLIGGWLLSWVIWLCLLYGVRTWDLALMVRLALALTWPLKWLRPVQRERERLRKAWERGQEAF